LFLAFLGSSKLVVNTSKNAAAASAFLRLPNHLLLLPINSANNKERMILVLWNDLSLPQTEPMGRK
jgi:hypothetical protein